MDFEGKYQNRRTIFRLIQEGLKAESEVVKKIGDRAVFGKKEILLLLSAWLMELKSETSILDAERNEVQSITETSLHKWIELQSEAERITIKLKSAENDFSQEKIILSRKSPIPFISRAVANDTKRKEIDAISDSAKQARSHRDDLKNDLRRNETDRQVLAERFFRDCLQNLGQLAQTQALGAEVTKITSHMTADINTIWVQFQERQSQDLIKISNAIDELKTDLAAFNKYLPRPKMQSY